MPTIQLHDELLTNCNVCTEDEIEEEMRRLQAEEAAKQMGLYTMNDAE